MIEDRNNNMKKYGATPAERLVQVNNRMEELSHILDILDFSKNEEKVTDMRAEYKRLTAEKVQILKENTFENLEDNHERRQKK